MKTPIALILSTAMLSGACALSDADEDALDLEETPGGDPDCPSDMLPSGLGNHCVPVVDLESEFPPGEPIANDRAIPNLKAMRNASAFGSLDDELPVPGGIGAGTLYDNGDMRVTSSADLRTVMIVHPSGIGTVSNWIFTTATNRTEMGVEPVGIYNGSDPGKFGVFDWSCSSSYPCSGGATTPSWIWTKPLSEMSCYWRTLTDPGGHPHYAMSYRNTTIKLASGSPPLWRNRVAIWNHCKDVWGNVYSHEYRANQHDCASDNTCGWWGPIIEEFIDGTLPNIKELGFWSSNLYYDGTLSILGANHTDWSPPASPWKVYHRTENRSWGVGTNTNK